MGPTRAWQGKLQTKYCARGCPRNMFASAALAAGPMGSPRPQGGNREKCCARFSARNIFRFRGPCAGAPWAPPGDWSILVVGQSGGRSDGPVGGPCERSIKKFKMKHPALRVPTGGNQVDGLPPAAITENIEIVLK